MGFIKLKLGPLRSLCPKTVVSRPCINSTLLLCTEAKAVSFGPHRCRHIGPVFIVFAMANTEELAQLLSVNAAVCRHTAHQALGEPHRANTARHQVLQGL